MAKTGDSREQLSFRTTLPALSRRRLLQASAASGLLAATGGGAPFATSALARQEEATQTLVASWADGPNGTDPAFHAALRSIDIYRACTLCPLMFEPTALGEVFVPDFTKLIPQAAEEWTVNDDWTSITITLKQGIMSPAGNELTVDDVIYSYQRMEGTKGHNWPFIQDALKITSTDAITKDDTYTYTINTEGPNALLEIIQAHTVVMILDSAVYQEHATDDDPWAVDWAGSNIAGHGPWVLTEYSPGQSWTLERHADYFDPAALTGNVASVVNRVVPESANRVALLQAGSVDMAMDLEAAELQSMESTPGVRVDHLPGNFLQWLGFTFGSADAPQLDDANVRQAIGYALPFDELLARPYLNQALQMTSTVAPSYAGYDVTSTVWTRTQDLDMAKELLAQTEWPEGFTTTLHYNLNAPGQEETGIIIRSALAEIGINVDLVQVQSADYFNLAFGGAGFPSLFIYKDMAGTPDVNFGTHLWLKTGHCCAPGKYSNEEVDALYEESQASTGDFDARVEFQRQIDDIALNQDPMGVPLQALGFHGASRENVGGWWWQSLNEVLWNRAWKQ
jgi:peptide/nickel transport system substrate-binding protein